MIGHVWALPNNIELKISESGTLEMQTGSQCLSSTIGKPNYPNEKGCARFFRGESGNLTFRIVNERICDASTSPPAKWALDEIRLANKNGLEPTTGEWSEPTVKLDREVEADFDVDTSNGVVKHTDNNDGSLSMSNNNTGNYYVWYRLRATCNGDPATAIYYDPRVDNEGGRN
jgi:hypothetical protein